MLKGDVDTEDKTLADRCLPSARAVAVDFRVGLLVFGLLYS